MKMVGWYTPVYIHHCDAQPCMEPDFTETDSQQISPLLGERTLSESGLGSLNRNIKLLKVKFNMC